MRTVSLACAATGLLLLAVLISRTHSAVHFGPGLAPGYRGRAQPPTTVDSPVEPGPGMTVIGAVGAVAILGYLLVVTLLLIPALVALFGAIRRRRASLGDPGPAPQDPDDVLGAAGTRLRLRQAAGEALLALRSGGPPGDAVVAAWLRFEQAAAASGTPRAAHQTPTEFTAAVLAAHRVPADALDAVRVRYQRARFGDPATLTEADRTATVDAVGALVHALDAGAEVPG